MLLVSLARSGKWRNNVKDTQHQHTASTLRDCERGEKGQEVTLGAAIRTMDMHRLFASVILIGLTSPASSMPHETVTVQSGGNATLLCKPPMDDTYDGVQWNKDGLEDHIFFCARDQKPDTEHQDPSFMYRVELLDAEMRHNDGSVMIKNMTRGDSGQFSCCLIKKRSESDSFCSEPYRTFNVVVSDQTAGPEQERADPKNKDGGNSRGRLGLMGLLVPLILACGYLLYRKAQAAGGNQLEERQLEEV